MLVHRECFQLVSVWSLTLAIVAQKQIEIEMLEMCFCKNLMYLNLKVEESILG